MLPLLLSPVDLLRQALPNRVVMAPMTRARASADGVPTALMATYYAQRASAGLIISEGINISRDAIGSPLTPGLFTEAQVAGWRSVIEAVHAAGGRIVAQLWHTGRVGHSAVRGGVLPVAPSALPILGQKHFTGNGMADYEVPRMLSTREVAQTVADYGQAAKQAMQAGFDGVELHAAFGYLPHQFLSEGSNQRSDAYGGSIARRCAFVIEAVQALCDAAGAGRVGIKLSPSISFNSISDPDPLNLYSHLLRELDRLDLGYVHLMNPLFPLDALPHWPRDVLGSFRSLVRCPVIANGGYDGAKAEAELAAGRADLVSFGQAFIANPDLPVRLARDAVLATAERSTMYGGSAAGYTDYPTLDAGAAPALAHAHVQAKA